MKQFIMFISLFGIALVAHAAFFAPVVINEIGAYERTNEEWVEIINRSNEPINLVDWKFFEDETNHKLTIFQGSATLASGEIAIIADDAALFRQKYPEVQTTIFDSSWSTLKESGEIVGLKNATGDAMEMFTYLPIIGGSLERVDPLIDDYTENNWIARESGNSVGEENDASHTEANIVAENEESTPGIVEETNATGEAGQTEESKENVLPETPFEKLNDEKETPLATKSKANQTPAPNESITAGSPQTAQTHLQTQQQALAATQSGGSGSYAPAPLLVKKQTEMQKTQSSLKKEEQQKTTSEEEIKKEAATKKTTSAQKTAATKKTMTVTKKSSSAVSAITPRKEQLEQTLFLTELLPNPQGQDRNNEWAEVWNPNDEQTDLLGWSLYVEGKKPMYIAKHLRIEPQNYAVITNKEANITLKNTATEISLLDPKLRIADTVTYPDAPDGNSYARIEIHEETPSYGAKADTGNSRWQWTETPSPGKENPTLYKFQGIVKNVEQDVFTLETEDKQELIFFFPDYGNEKTMLILAVKPKAEIQVLAEKIPTGYRVKEATMIRMHTETQANIFGIAIKDIVITIITLAIIAFFLIRRFFHRKQSCEIIEQHEEPRNRNSLRPHSRHPRIQRISRHRHISHPRVSRRRAIAPRIPASR